MKKRVSKSLSFLIALFLLVQVLLPAGSIHAAETETMLPPSNLSYQALTPTDVKLTWSAVFGATGYKVYEITDGQLIVRGTSATNSFAINGLPEGQYTYVVSTLSPNSESGPCAPLAVNIAYPDMASPILSYTVKNGNDIALSWTASPYAQSYQLYQIQADGQKTPINTQTALTYTVVNASEGAYQYAVSASNSTFGESPLSAPVEVNLVFPTMVAPGNVTFTVSNVTDVSLKWNAASYATNYRVYQIVDGQKVLKSTVTGTTVTYTNQPSGENIYEVYSYSDRFGESLEGSRVTATIGSVTMIAPANLTYKLQNANDIVLTWSSVTYANSYKIYQVIDGQKVLKSTVTGTTVTFTNQPAGDYIYEVHSYSDRFGESSDGAQLAFVLGTVTLAAPANFAYKLQNINDVVLTWTAVTNANYYKIYQVIDGQKILKSTVTGATVTYTNQPAGDYVYEVHSYSDRFGESPEGSQVTFTIDATMMAAPANFAYKLQNINDVVLTWTAAANANSYKIYQVVDGQKVLKSTVTTGTTVTYTNQPAGEYTYEVHSVSTRFGESPEGSQVTLTIEATVMAAPDNARYQLNNGNDIVLNWDAATNANSYKVYLISNGQKVLKSTVTGTTVTYANQPQGNYTYEIHSVSTRFGESLEGSQVIFPLVYPTMKPPENLIQTIKNATDFSLNWNASDYATSYKVYQIVNGQKVLKSTVTGLTVTYMGMAPGDYTYEVHSVSTRFGESPEGTLLMMTLNGQTMTAPGNPTYSIANGNDVTLKWTAVPYATNYKVYQIVDGQKVLKSSLTSSTLTVTYTNQPEGQYDYEIHSYSSILGESPEGAEITFELDFPVVAAPGSLSYKIQNGNDIVLTWTGSYYANFYRVYEMVDGQKFLKYTNTTGTGTVTFSNLKAGEYTYIVHAVNNRFGESPEGKTVTVTLENTVMQPPSGFTKTIANGNDLTFKWNTVTYATAYKLYQVADGQEVLVKSQTGTTFTVTNHPAGEFTYVVRSYSDRFGESAGSELPFTLVFPVMQAPGGFTKTIANGNDLTLKWNAATYATGYNLYQVIDGQEVLKKTQTGTTVTFTNMPEDDYTYVVRSYSSRFGESPEGSNLQFALVWPVMQAPGGLTKTIANGNDLTLKWNAVTYATGYNLYQVIDGVEVLKRTQAGTTVTFTNMPEDDYTYVVRSYSSRFGESPEGSNLEFALVWPVMQAPGGLTKTIANGNDITLKWNAVTYATAYRVYQWIDGQKVLKSTLTGTTVTYVNMPAGDYSYEVDSYSSRFGESPIGAVSDFELIWPVVQPPVVSGTVFNANNITLAWPSVAWANEYRVYKLVGETRQLLYTGTALNYKVYNLSEDTHSFEVTAYNTRFGESAPSNRVTENIVFPIMEPPVASIKLLSDTSARISWNFVTYANGYNVYELVDGLPVLLTENLNNLSFTVSDLPYKDHEYYVTSYSNSFGESDKSNIVVAKLIIDTKAPVTVANAPDEWTNQDQIVTLSATDDVTGVAGTFYSLNDGDYKAGTSVNVDQEGVTKVSFYSVDKVGNKESVRMIEVKIDKVAPVTTSNVLEGWNAKDATVKLTATDEQSGVAKTYYAIDGSEYQEGTSLTVSDDGIHQIRYYSIDQAGNQEAEHTVEVKIDGTAPVTVSNAQSKWSKDDVNVELTATDVQSGVAKTYYAVDASEYREGSTFTVSGDGTHQIRYYSIDQAGNQEPEHIIEVKIDAKAPVTVSNVPSSWSKEDVAVALTATDPQSGVAKTYYAVDASEYREGSTFTVSGDGTHQIRYYSIDQAGNKEAEHTVEVKIDGKAPVTVSNAPSTWSKEDVALALTATDLHSGVAKTYYSVDGSLYNEGRTFTIRDEGIHNVAFYSVDAAGNIETANTVAVRIDKSAPIVAMNLGEEVQAGTKLKLSYSANDKLSGVANEKMTVSVPGSTMETVLTNGSELVVNKPGVYTVTVTVTDAVGLTTTLKKQFTVFLQASITVTPTVIKGNKGVFTVRVDLPDGYNSQGFELDSITLNGVKALNSNNGYYNQAKLGQFKFERSDFNWTGSEVTLHFRGYVNGILVVGQKTVNIQK